MPKRISEIKARGAEIVGHGTVLKVLAISMVLVIAAFIIIFMVA